jgi:uncharacterized protein involved in response to NO
MLTIEDPKKAAGFPVLNLGFRPFFLAAGGFAVISMLIWTALYQFGWAIPLHGMPATIWHAHEMIYGYAMAVAAGFLLTAVKNWTGVQTLHGAPLLVLFLLWLAARLVPFLAPLPMELMALLDLGFMAFLLVAVALPVVKVRQWKQVGILSLLLLMLIANTLFYLGLLGVLSNGVRWGLYSGLYLIVALVFAMGRRVIPFFIEKGVGYPVQLKSRLWLDWAVLVLFLLYALADVFTPYAGLAALLAAVQIPLHGLRMVDWHTRGIWRKPLLWVLYLAVGAMLLGFVLKLAAYQFAISPFLAVHAFTVGGIGMVTVGMMARVTLGHTGRNVFAPPTVDSWIFAVLFLGTVVRVIVPLLDTAHYGFWVGLSQLLWIAAFSLFFSVHLPMLYRPRVDGRFG